PPEDRSRDVTVPGFTELDLVAHPGHRADGEFAHSPNVTDIHSTGVETRAVLGRAESRVQTALEEIRQALPFRRRGIDSDNVLPAGGRRGEGAPHPCHGAACRVARLRRRSSADPTIFRLWWESPLPIMHTGSAPAPGSALTVLNTA